MSSTIPFNIIQSPTSPTPLYRTSPQHQLGGKAWHRQDRWATMTINHHQNLGFLFRPVYFVSGLVVSPRLRSLSFFLITNSFRFTIFFFPRPNMPSFFPYFSLFTFTQPSLTPSPYTTSSSISPSPVFPTASTMPRFLLTPASSTRKYFLARVLLGQSTISPPEKPLFMAAVVIISSCRLPSGQNCRTARPPMRRQSQSDWKNLQHRLKGLSFLRLATHSHWIVDMLMAPSNTPGRNFHPCPMSTCHSPPCDSSFAAAMSSMSLLMSIPSQTNSFACRVSPEIPDPHPISSTNEPASILRSSMARSPS